MDITIDKELKFSTFKKGDVVTKEDIEKELNRLKLLHTNTKNKNLSLKIILNSVYGVIGFKKFIAYNRDVAQSVTKQSEDLIKFTIKIFNEFFRNWHTMTEIHEKMGMSRVDKYEQDVINYADSIIGDTKLMVENNDLIFETNIEDLFTNVDMVIGEKEYCYVKNVKSLTLDKNGKSVFRPIKYVMRHKTTKQLYKVNFTNHWNIGVTEDHSLMGYKSKAIDKTKYCNNNPLNRIIETKPQEIGDKIKTIVSLKKIPFNENSYYNYPRQLYEFMGYFIGDGSFYKNKQHNKDYYVRIAAGLDKDEFIIKIINPLKNMGYISSYWNMDDKGDIAISGVKLATIISENFKGDSGDKIIPEWLLNEKEENVCSFLRGLFSADGTIMKENGAIIRHTTINDNHIQSIRKLLYKVGISNSVFKENNPNTYKTKNKLYNNGSISKHVYVQNKYGFRDKIGFILDRKNERLINLGKSNFKNTIKDYEFDLQKVKNIEKLDNKDYEYVYDVEIEETHTFFANNVLVHNTDSVFLLLDSVMKTTDFSGSITDFALSLDKHVLADYVKNKLEEYVLGFNGFTTKKDGEPSLKLHMEQVNDSVLWVAKKMYIKNPVWDEGKILKPLEDLQIKGLEINKPSIPKYVRGKLRLLVEYIMDKKSALEINELLEKIGKIKDEFQTINILEICKGVRCNNMEKWIMKDTDELETIKDTPYHIKAAGYYNHLLHINKFGKKYDRIKSTEKVQFYHIKEEPGYFAFPSNIFPAEFAPPIYLELQFEKVFLQPFNNILEALDVPKLNPELLFFDSIW